MKKILFLLLLVLAAYLIWRWWKGGDQSAALDRGQELVYDRLWIDRMPERETDTAQLFAAITEQPVGLFQSSSMWKGDWELFRYENQGDGKIVIRYPQSSQSERVSYRAGRCSERGFDYCLELVGSSHGARRYYSRKGWEVGGVKDLIGIESHIGPALNYHP